MRVLAIGGLDPSGRAGVLADAAMIRSLGAEALAVVTCITAQGRRPLSRAVDPKLVAAQLEALDRVDAVKIGAVPNRAVLKVIARWLPRGTPAVVDPVTVTSKGLRLSTLRPHDFELVRQKSVVLTPNQTEAPGFLVGLRPVPGLSPAVTLSRHRWPQADMQRLRGFGAIVVKSFGPGVDAVFLEGKRPIRLSGSVLVRSKLHRGTGCRFASAMAVDLAKGHTVTHAAGAAKRAVRKFLQTPILLQV